VSPSLSLTRRIVVDRARDQVAHVGQLVVFLDNTSITTLPARQHFANRRHLIQRTQHRAEIARRR
jgi:hypothetical protein